MLIHVTPDFLIRSPWRPVWPRPGRRQLILSASGSFPPGHPSTRLGLTLLAAACRPQPPASLLDVGCGSGVLALSGALLGIPRVVGVDIAAAAIRTAAANARRNALDGAVTWLRGSTAALRGCFALVVANLPAPVQTALAADLARLTAPGGSLILAGYRDTQEEDLLAYYTAPGWRQVSRICMDWWEIELPRDRSYTWVGWTLQKE